jgi:hypothetical protein
MPLSRREFLRATAATAAAAVSPPAFSNTNTDGRCIFLLLTGGPSHLDTFDPKPDAPGEVRGPFRPIRTTVPGVFLSELLPLTAARMDRIAVVRSLHHNEAPIHETGLQLLQTGRLCRGTSQHPHFGAALGYLTGRPWAILPGPLGDTGIAVSQGQTAGPLGESYRASSISVLRRASGRKADVEGFTRLRVFTSGSRPDARQKSAERSEFGGACRQALEVIESGANVVVVNMFRTVYESLSWDCHADGGLLPTDLADYRDTICPAFDMAYANLLDDLDDRGLLDSTLVVATGEFGRTPYINARGGRDHWPGVWSALFAGGGGGRVIGASDALGGEPKDRPVTPAEVTATIYHALGIDPRTRIPGPDGQVTELVDAEPIAELF